MNIDDLSPKCTSLYLPPKLDYFRITSKIHTFRYVILSIWCLCSGHYENILCSCCLGRPNLGLPKYHRSISHRCPIMSLNHIKRKRNQLERRQMTLADLWKFKKYKKNRWWNLTDRSVAIVYREQWGSLLTSL